jgi:ADP-ribose pyrophosphatase YjhB (NUDIX family)
VELGETMIEAVRREMKEETGLDVDVGPLVELFDRVHRDAEGRVRYHFVIADFLCAPIGGQEQAGDDADALAWAGADDLAAYRINRHAMDVILKGLALVERNNDL